MKHTIIRLITKLAIKSEKIVIIEKAIDKNLMSQHWDLIQDFIRSTLE